LARIQGRPLSPIQLREVAARLAYGNTLLANRPVFSTERDGDSRISIRSQPPAPGPLADLDRTELGGLIAYSCGQLLDPKRQETEEVLRRVRKGEAQFLFHDDGTFIQD
jgi:hypothetical protein